MSARSVRPPRRRPLDHGSVGACLACPEPAPPVPPLPDRVQQRGPCFGDAPPSAVRRPAPPKGPPQAGRLRPWGNTATSLSTWGRTVADESSTGRPCASCLTSQPVPRAVEGRGSAPHWPGAAADPSPRLLPFPPTGPSHAASVLLQ